MGIDAFIYCMNCRQKEYIGRAYRLKEDCINKKLNKELIDKLIILIEQVDIQLQKGLFEEYYHCNLFEDLIGFYQEHKEHELWLINDFFETKEACEK